jgi:8-oxo-dGTP pyrophosphatase MutT (NUDIX family)
MALLRQEVSAGGVVVREGPDGLEVALAEQRDRNLGRTTVRLPKGHLDPGETAEQAAIREVLEETGLRARIEAPLPEVSYRYHETHRKADVEKRVVFFLMRYESGEAHAADAEFERVFWHALSDAPNRVTFDSERTVLAAAIALLS